ncbi:MAG: hypothetical protein E6J34_17435 [Chloroflexi bacterium]|nr:MAG: hypothetical protein E6J34_17435 [Chloroflexota bacterium]
MDATVISAIIAALTALAVQLVTHRIQQSTGKKQDEKRINEEYLNPLRLYLEESYFRIAEIMQRAEAGGGKSEAFFPVSNTEELSHKDASWFNGEGCYFISSCYFTACLFATIKKVRDDVPYLRLRQGDDTQLLQLLLKINLGFLKKGGVYYALQQSIGEQMYTRAEKRLMTYREFCEALQDPQKRVWFDRLLRFFLETGKGRHLDRVRHAIEAIYASSTFLDKKVGGGPSLKVRLQVEGITHLTQFSALHTKKLNHGETQ